MLSLLYLLKSNGAEISEIHTFYKLMIVSVGSQVIRKWAQLVITLKQATDNFPKAAIWFFTKSATTILFRLSGFYTRACFQNFILPKNNISIPTSGIIFSSKSVSSQLIFIPTKYNAHTKSAKKKTNALLLTDNKSHYRWKG